MTNIYEQVEKLLNEQDNHPKWVDEMLFELREIKKLLQNTNKSKIEAQNKTGYFTFVNKLRKEMRADIISGIYPEVHYQDKILGVNFKGHLYDKATTEELPALEAFAVYRFLYENRSKLDKYLKK